MQDLLDLGPMVLAVLELIQSGYFRLQSRFDNWSLCQLAEEHIKLLELSQGLFAEGICLLAEGSIKGDSGPLVSLLLDA